MMLLSLEILGELIVVAIKNVFWFLIDVLTQIFLGFIDFIAGLLPDYTIPAPSVYFGNNAVVPFLNWVFPVDHFIVCLSIIVVNMGIVFVWGPLLRLVRIAK